MTQKTTFESLGLNEWLIEQLKAVGIMKPTPIQSSCTPKILEGNDCIGCAKTGSGKTAAFALPILQKLSDDPYGIFALIITPTRELAFQIADQFKALGGAIRLTVSVITGGRDMIKQGLELAERPHIVVATPGRIADHIRTGTNFSLKKIKFLVLDEADRLIEENFGDELKTIFPRLSKKRQTLLFSATMTESLKELQDVALKTPFFYEQKTEVATVRELDQRYVLMPADVKDAFLVHIIDQYQETHKTSLIMVFVQTCKYAQLLHMVFRSLGLKAVTIHSMIKQKQRLEAIHRFKSHLTKILIATDVAARGLDVPLVDLVINHNVSIKPKDYIHRVGRTARAGRSGMAVTLVTQFDIKLVHAIEEKINYKMEEYKVDEIEVTKIVTEVAVARRQMEIKLDECEFGKVREDYKRKRMIQSGEDPDRVEKKLKKLKDVRMKRNQEKRKMEKLRRKKKKKQADKQSAK